MTDAVGSSISRHDLSRVTIARPRFASPRSSIRLQHTFNSPELERTQVPGTSAWFHCSGTSCFPVGNDEHSSKCSKQVSNKEQALALMIRHCRPPTVFSCYMGVSISSQTHNLVLPYALIILLTHPLIGIMPLSSYRLLPVRKQEVPLSCRAAERKPKRRLRNPFRRAQR